MKKLADYGTVAVESWNNFVREYALTDTQAEQFETFALELLAWNEKFNLTAITDIPALIADHFQDSLSIAKFMPLEAGKWTCDVGSGGGFPGIPLKIMYPDTPMVLVEVNNKKIGFLNTMIEQLGLKNIVVSPLDWRTFVHKAPYPISTFFARASLRPNELLRVFEKGCAYQDATVVYWASALWQIDPAEKPFFVKEEHYTVGQKNRRLIFFRRLAAFEELQKRLIHGPGSDAGFTR